MLAFRRRFFRQFVPLLIALPLLWASAGCCIVDDLFPEVKFQREVDHLSPETVSLHTQIPYLDPKGPDTCGLSCLDMIFAYHHIALPDKEFEPFREKAARESGVSVNDIVGLLQEAGFKTLRRQGRLTWPGQAPAGTPWFKDINNPLSQIHFGRPVILHLKLPTGSEHFLLLVGFDEPRRKYILLSPGVGPLVLDAAKLEAMWEAGERVFIAYKPPDRPAAHVEPPAR